MNPRLTKEFRPLLIPWCVCALLAFGHTTRLWGGALQGIASFAFFAGCLLLAVLPFGLEFQNRTWTVLLSQPLERPLLWKEKFIAATVAVFALTSVHALLALPLLRIQSLEGFLSDALPVLGFLAATICSAGLLTLAARSVIGGMVFTGVFQFAVVAVVTGLIYLAYKIFGIDSNALLIDKSPILATYAIAGAFYSALSLWLGWRTFTTMEVRDATPSTDIRLPERFTPKRLATLFRCTPTGALGNLIRKEVGLQKPVFTIAAAFVGCWVIAFLLLLMEPTYTEVYKGVLNGFTGVYMVIVILVTGCVSLGDEKSLGLAAWHLTLPASSRQQWFVKLLVSFATAILVGVILPLLLSCLTLFKANVGLVAFFSRDGWAAILTISAVIWGLVVLGFWSASFWENTVRAALATIVALIGIGTFAQLGAWVALEYSPGLQRAFVGGIAGHEGVVPYAVLLITLVVTLVALRQSLIQFRRVRSSSIVVLKCSLVLATVTFIGAFWCADLVKSINKVFPQ